MADKPLTVTKFYAEWCGPCKAFSPVLEKFVNDHNLEYEEFNIDENPHLVDQFKVTSVPTTILFNNGEEINRVVGVRTIWQLEAALL